jgi:squalene-hopene/tetraprenyl-beta-curcumene cyclase
MSTQPTNPEPSQPTQGVVPRFGRMDLGMDRVESGIARAVKWFWGKQHEQGYWVGELEADSMLEADYIFMHTLLGTGDRGKMERCINEILRHQNEDGGMEPLSGRSEQCELRSEVLPRAQTDGMEC